MATLDVTGNICINLFQVSIGEPTFSGGNSSLSIPYIGKANPEVTAELTTFEYSLDGNTWESMTATQDTITTNLIFTPVGATFNFNWVLKEDLGDSIYNKEILIRFKATSTGMTTALVVYSLFFKKEVLNLSNAQLKAPLPADYPGISGGDLLSNAP